MALDNGNGLYRLSPEELLLIHNYRLCNNERQDVLLYFSGEMAKQPNLEKPPSNVFLLTGRR